MYILFFIIFYVTFFKFFTAYRESSYQLHGRTTFDRNTSEWSWVEYMDGVTFIYIFRYNKLLVNAQTM